MLQISSKLHTTMETTTKERYRITRRMGGESIIIPMGRSMMDFSLTMKSQVTESTTSYRELSTREIGTKERSTGLGLFDFQIKMSMLGSFEMTSCMAKGLTSMRTGTFSKVSG